MSLLPPRAGTSGSGPTKPGPILLKTFVTGSLNDISWRIVLTIKLNRFIMENTVLQLPSQTASTSVTSPWSIPRETSLGRFSVIASALASARSRKLAVGRLST